MKLINPERPLDAAGRAEIVALVERQRAASGLLMTASNYMGGQVEDALKVLPKGFRDQIDAAARAALAQSYGLAQKSRQGSLGRSTTSERMNRVLGTISGALGGLGGIGTALAELPVATTLIFRAVQGVAESHGEDLSDPEIRAQCLMVFGAGGPGSGDDGIDTSFFGARLGITGPALNSLIARVAPRFAAVLSQKLAAQAVPILGAAAGAGTNYAFVGYYTEMAHVHFGLRRLTQRYDETEVIEEFHRVLGQKRLGKKSA
jgi:MFS family permease